MATEQVQWKVSWESKDLLQANQPWRAHEVHHTEEDARDWHDKLVNRNVATKATAVRNVRLLKRVSYDTGWVEQ